MTRFILTLMGIVLAIGIQAQTTKDEMLANPELMSGNQLRYPLNFKAQTPAPKGYKPFYVSHYGRHGSRYHYSGSHYEYIYKLMLKADSANVLTNFGKTVADRAKKLYDDGFLRAGDLTQTGCRQHRGIAERMFRSFPEVFADSANIDVKASTSGRCILSMDAFCQQLQGLNPTLQIINETSRRLMPFINYENKKIQADKLGSDPWKSAYENFVVSKVNPDRFIANIFTDTAFVSANTDALTFMRQLYEISCNLLGVDDLDFDFSDAFTPDERFGMWQAQNAWWYGAYSVCPLTDGYGVRFAKNLLTNFLDEADKAIAGNGTSATLRFGHDTGLLPLTGLMEIDGCSAQISNLDELYTQWTDFRIIPMAANLQMILYRSDKKNDILVKVLLNENEVRLPVPTKNFPYYKWADFESYYRNKLSQIE